LIDNGSAIGAPVARRLLRWTVLLAGAAHAALAALQHRMNPDGVNYLDMGDAIARHDWSMAINPVWSPLYPLILGSVNNVFRPGMSWEFPLVQGINFTIFLFALAAFEAFWHELTRLRIQRRSDVGESPWLSFPAAAWEWTGYGLFMLCTLRMIKLRTVTPDLLMFGLTLLACTVMLRIRRNGSSTRRCVALGVLLGIAYLAKSVMFPVALVFVLVCAVPWSRQSIGIKGASAAIAGLLLVAGPWIVMLSGLQGKLTFGDAGRITYAKYATSVPYPHWQGEGASGTPHHPSRRIHSDPPIYEFGFPVGGTYAISYDPTYWYCGLEAGFDGRRQLRVLAHSGFLLFDLLLRKLGPIFLVAALFYLSARRPWRGLAVRPEWSLIVPALSAMGMYSIVLVEERYLAVFLLLLVAGVLCGLPAPAGRASRLPRRAAWLMVVVLWLNVLAFHARMATEATAATGFTKPAPLDAAVTAVDEADPPGGVPSWMVASALHSQGIGPGSSIAFIGDSGRAAYWARLARVRITAEITPADADAFWYTEGERRTAVLNAFSGRDLVAVVAEAGPAGALLDGFEILEGTPLLIHRLPLPTPEEEEERPAPGTIFAP
jgi:hypothetical protein